MAKVFALGMTIMIGLFGYSQWQEAQIRQQILATTVQITMIVPQLADVNHNEIEPLPIPPDEYRPIAQPESYVIAEGLGTLVKMNGRTLLITHDHWSQLTADLGDVQFRDAAGVLLAEMDLYQFKRLIVGRDKGTMVLVAPNSLQDLVIVPTKVGVTENDGLLLVHRQKGQVVVSSVQRVETGLKDGVAVWRLQGQAVENGDSGGGVWVNGQLVATMWTTVMMENPVTGERQATDLSVAAVFNNVVP